MLDHASKELRPSPRKARPHQRESWIKRQCPACGQWYEIRLADAAKLEARQSPCKSCSSKSKFKLALAKWGRPLLLGRMAAAYRSRPTSSELRAMEALEGVDYEFQVVVGDRYIADFVLPGGKVLEINGWRHRQQGAARDAALTALWQGPILFVDDDDPDFEKKIKAFAHD